MAALTPDGAMGHKTDDAAVDALRPEVVSVPGRLRIRAGAPAAASGGLAVLDSLITLSDLDDLLLLADGLTSGESAVRAVDGGGIHVVGEAVEVWDAGSRTAVVGRMALARFMAKVLALGAESVDDPDMAGRLAGAAESLEDFCR